MITIYLSLILTSLVAIVLVKAIIASRYWKSRKIPYESLTSAFYTNCVRFRCENAYSVLEELHVRYGSVYGTFNGFTPVLRIKSIDGIRDALVKKFSTIHDRTLFGPTGSPLWDKNIIALDYETWKAIRQVSGLAFTSSKLKTMVPTIESIANRFTKYIGERQEVDVQETTQGFMLDIIAAVAYGLDLDTLNDPSHLFVLNSTQAFAPSLGLSIVVALPGLIRYLPCVHFPPKQVTDFFIKFTSSLLNNRRVNGGNCERTGKSDILDLWLAEQAKRPHDFTDEVITAQAFAFFSAGFETSSYTFALTLYMLAMYPELQDLAYNEVHEVTEGTTSLEVYERMKFIEACFLETLRMFPTDAVIDRKTAVPCTVAGVPVDANIAIQIAIPAVNHDFNVFPDPYTFRPQRFVEGLNPYSVQSSIQLSAMMSFGDGPRGCIGRRLALLQLAIGLCAILRRFRIIPVKVHPARGKLPLDFIEGCLFQPAPRHALLVRLEPRRGTE